MSLLRDRLFAPLTLLIVAPGGYAAPVDQWANRVLEFSSEYCDPDNCASHATGAPNVTAYGDDANAWAPVNQDGTREFLSLGYRSPVYAYGATIRETLGNGFVYEVEVRDTGGVWHSVWTGTDPNRPGRIANFFVSWPPTNYLVAGVRVRVNTDANRSEWEEIDAVQLHGYNLNQPAVRITAPDTVASESFRSTGVFEVIRDLSATTDALAVNYQITGTAGNGVDYNSANPLTGTVTIAAGRKSAPIVIIPVDDRVKEKPETVTVTLTAGEGYQFSGKLNTATVTINSNE